MKIVTLAECKERLHIDFNDSDSDITVMANSIESSLFFATGLTFDFAPAPDDTDDILNLAKEYILTKLEIDYYKQHSELNNARLTYIIKQLQVAALL